MSAWTLNWQSISHAKQRKCYQQKVGVTVRLFRCLCSGCEPKRIVGTGAWRCSNARSKVSRTKQQNPHIEGVSMYYVTVLMLITMFIMSRSWLFPGLLTFMEKQTSKSFMCTKYCDIKSFSPSLKVM